MLSLPLVTHLRKHGQAGAPAHFHSRTHWLWQASEMEPDIVCQIHPQKAAALGIQTGDRVVIASARGSIQAIARVDQGIRPVAIYVPLGGDERQPFQLRPSVNWLIDKDQRCPLSDQTNLKVTLCRVRKAGS
ncbi:MAG: hypothetical protein HY691_13305 [Chloroflexi bacterium]|nr:hypothetical protein [Chloroflexota bacterium]